MKLKFMLVDKKVAVNVRNKLLLANVPNQNICFLAKHGAEHCTELRALKPATMFDSSNCVQRTLRSVCCGAALGLLTGLFAFTFTPWAVNTQWYKTLVITTALGAATWALLTAIVGVTIFNSSLNANISKIEQGEVLMFVTVPFYKAKTIRKIVAQFK